MIFGIVVDGKKKKAVELGKKIEEFLAFKKVSVEKNKKKFGDVDLVVVLGGDGLLLHAACEHAALGKPFFGINVGRLGFLTSAEANNWKKALESLIGKRYITSERMMLEAEIADRKFRALNEIVVKGAYRVCDLEIMVGGKKLVSISGDGVIISTQTGSTAYSFSCGGPIVDPNFDCLLVTPINAHGLPIPSIILSSGDVIEIKVKEGKDISLVVDGQEHIKVSKGEKVKVVKGKSQVKLLYFTKHQFLETLNEKFCLKLGR